MTIEQMHAEWMEWVRPLMAKYPKSDLCWIAWQEAWKRAPKQCEACPIGAALMKED